MDKASNASTSASLHPVLWIAGISVTLVSLAGIAGAVGGGMLGNSIEKSQRKTVAYQVTVRMEDGTTRLIDSETQPPWRIGDKVKLVAGAIVSR